MEEKQEIIRKFTRKLAKILVFFSFIFVIFGVSSAAAQTASLYFSPSSGTHNIGSTFSVSVYVSSVDQAMNAASGVISFPKDKLEVVSLSKTSSIFNLWVLEPAFSNTFGTINFEGVVLNPGFTGSSGKIITVTFKVKAGGNAALNFSSGSVLANDGQGTNILASLGKASFVLGGAAPAPETPAAPAKTGSPETPQLSSLTHPDPNKWYNNTEAKFIWPVQAGINAVRLLYDKFFSSAPKIVYEPAISEKELKNLEDGVYYFHAQFRNGQGWGGAAHFRFQVDTEPPLPFKIRFVDDKETDNPRPAALFETTDSLSGVAYYRVKISDGEFIELSEEKVKGRPYILPLQEPGKRTLLVQAYDKAGNFTTASEEFIVKPIEAPVITEYPKELNSKETLKVKGTALSEVQVVVWLQKDRNEAQSQTVQSDKKGEFSFIKEEMEDGSYKLWAEAIDERGAKSEPSEKFNILVNPSAFLKIGSLAVSYLSVIIPLIALVIFLLFLLWYSWFRFSLFRKRVRKEVREAEDALHKAFDLLKEDIKNHVKILEKARTKRELTAEEEKIVRRLKSDLDAAKKFVKKEIDDIKKEIK